MNYQQFFIRLTNVREITGLSTSSIYRMMSSGEFPKQIQLGSNSVAWTKKSIDDWCHQKVAEATS